MKQATARVTANWRRLYAMPVASVYPAYTAKAEKKGRTRAEVDEIFRWLTGHSQTSLEAELENKTSFEDFFAHAPKMNASRSLITGVVCGVRVEEIQEPRMREIRTSEDEILMLSQKQRLARSRSGTHQLDGELHPERQPADLSAGKLIRCGLPPLRPWIAADANPKQPLASPQSVGQQAPPIASGIVLWRGCVELSDVDLRDLDRIIDLYAEIPNRALDLRASKGWRRWLILRLRPASGHSQRAR